MSPKQNDFLVRGHQWLTWTVIPGLLTVILYFLVKIDKKVDFSTETVIRHEQWMIEHERRLNNVEQYVFKPR